MKISQEGLNLIKKFEGYRSAAYQDSVGVWTIGYGHTLGVKPGDTVTAIQAETYLRQDVKKVEDTLNATGVNMAQNQFDALVSLFYNVGTGYFSNFLPLLKQDVNSESIPAKIQKYVYAGGNVLKGLVNRRAAEAALYKKKSI